MSTNKTPHEHAMALGQAIPFDGGYRYTIAHAVASFKNGWHGEGDPALCCDSGESISEDVYLRELRGVEAPDQSVSISESEGE